MTIGAMKQALEALELALRCHGVMLLSDPPKDAWKYHGVEADANKAITALSTAIAEAEKQEPVAWETRERFYEALHRAVENVRQEMRIKTVTMRCKDYDLALPIVDSYGGHVLVGQVTPPAAQRKPLTEEQLKPIADEYRILFGGWVVDFARAIEAAHGIKGEA